MIYRSRTGVDMSAIITGIVTEPEIGDVHLHVFPPPGHAAPWVSPEWGARHATNLADPELESWRWPERVR